MIFVAESDYDRAEVGQLWRLPEIKQELTDGADRVSVEIGDSGEEIALTHDFSEHEREILVARRSSLVSPRGSD